MADAAARGVETLGSRRTQAERSEAMRRRLLDAATAALREKGFAAFRMADVAERAGVSKGAQLHHFPTKDGLIVAVFEDLYASVSERAERRRHFPSTLGEIVRELIADSHDFFFGESFAVSLDITMGATRDPQLKDAVLGVVRRFRKGTEEMWVDRLVEAGVERERAHDALWLVNSLIRGFAVRALWEPDHARFARLEQTCAKVVLAFLTEANPS